MLGDAANSYNPIIQAMIATASLKQKSQQQEQEKEKNKAEQAAQKEHLKQAQQILENVHEHNLAQEDVARMQAEADHLRAKSATFLALQQARQQGSLDPVKAFEMIQPHLTQAMRANPALGKFREQLGGKDLTAAEVNPEMPGLGGESQPAAAPPAPQMAPDEMFGDPRAQMGLAAEAAGLKAKAESQGELPAKQALQSSLFQQQSELELRKLASEEKRASEQRATQLELGKMSRATQMALGQLEAKTRLTVAGLGGGEASQNLVKSRMMGFATGEIEPTNSPIDRVAYEQLQNAGFQKIDKKSIAEAKGMQNITPLLDKLEKLASKLPDTPIGAAIEGGKQAAINAFTTSKLRNDINIINSQIMNVARTTEGVTGRPLAAAMKPELESLASVTTRSNMVDRVNNLRDNYVNKFNNVIFAGTPPEQRELIDKKWGLKPVERSLPDFLKVAPKTHPKTGTALNVEESIRVGKPQYEAQ